MNNPVARVVPPAWRSNVKKDGVGASLRRREDDRFVVGAGRFVDDLTLPNTQHAIIVRSTIAHARIVRIDVDGLKSLPDAQCFTADDLPDTGAIPVRVANAPMLHHYLQRPLAAGKVRYVGEPVAVVVAPTREEALAAAELVSVEYDELPVVLDVRRAAESGAAELHDRTNVVATFVIEKGDTAKAFSEAAIIVEEDFQTHRHTGAPMETRGLLAAYDTAREILQVWGFTKLPYVSRIVLARMLGLAEESIHFVEPDVGGSFGVRGEFYPEDLLIPWLAMCIGRPVKWREERTEHFTAINHSRSQRWKARIAADGDGRIIGLEATLDHDMGAYVRTHGVIVAHHAATSLPGPYYVSNYRCDVSCVVTNTTPTGTLRAPGMFEASAVRERLIDLLAQRLGADRAEIRRRNFIRPEQMPYQIYSEWHGPYKPAYDNGDFPAIFNKTLQHYGRLKHDGNADDDQLRGVGIVAAVEPSGLGPFERAKIRVDSNGSVAVYVGSTSQGQGMETTLAQVAGEALGIPSSRIRVRHGDSSHLRLGYGTNASRSAVMAGGAVHRAAVLLRDKAVKAAAAMLEVPVEEVVYEAGSVHVRGRPERTVSLGDMARASSPFALFLGGAPVDTGDVAEGLEALAHVRNVPEGTAVFSVHVAEVAVDRDTGSVTIERYLVGCDVGRAINPMIVEGQISGGVVQGIGGALQEELVYDDAGQLVSSSFLDYSMPLASTVPPVEVLIFEESASPSNPLGVKGVGEVGTSGAGAAILAAVADALSETGAHLCELPLTPERVFRALSRATARSSQ